MGGRMGKRNRRGIGRNKGELEGGVSWRESQMDRERERERERE